MIVGPLAKESPLSVSDGSEADNMIFYVTFILMLLFFFITAAASEKYKPSVGHETTYTVILGLVISIILWYAGDGPSGNDKLSSTFKFSSSFFMDFMLPPLVFNAGYTMRKQKFFDNLGNIAMNGLCVTIVCFIIYGMGGILLINLDMTMMNYHTDTSAPISMTNF